MHIKHAKTDTGKRIPGGSEATLLESLGETPSFIKMGDKIIYIYGDHLYFSGIVDPPIDINFSSGMRILDIRTFWEP